MKHALAISIVLVMLVACAPTPPATPLPATTTLPTNTLAPTATSIPTSMPTATSPQPRVIVDNTVLYSGPGNVGYSTLAQLASGTQVIPVGTFGEFIKVQVGASGKSQEGFVLGTSLQNIPNNLPQLNQDQVPWSEMVNVVALPSWNNWSTWLENGILKQDNPSQSSLRGYRTFVNDYVPIKIQGPFAVEVQFNGQGTEYGVLLFGRLQTGTDWWSGIRRLDVRVYNGRMSLLFYDGTRAGGTTFNLPSSLIAQRIIIQFNEDGSTIRVVGEDGKPISDDTTRLPVPLFPDRVLYVGLNTAPNATLEVSALSIRVPPLGRIGTVDVATPPTQAPSLRELAQKRNIQMGALLGFRDLHSYAIFNKEYDRLISEGFHWASIRPSKDTYDFSRTDLEVAFANRNGLRVEAHHLVWGAPDHLPEWLKNGNFTRDDLIQILHDHINTVVTHYKGRVSAWSIANEVTSRNYKGNHDGDFWYKYIGPDYVEMSLRWAKEADPNAILLLNDNGNEGRQTTNNIEIADRMYDLVKQLKQKDVPIDAVGMQMHLLGPFAYDKSNPPKKEDVIANMKKFAELGVDIYVTEFDVYIADIPGSQSEKWAFQAKVYGDMLQACLESKVCKAFSIFGITDKQTWYGICQGCKGLPNSDPLPFDKDYNPKPAYFAMRDALAGK